MTLGKFLDDVIANGIEAAREDYRDYPIRLRGAIAGFEACRGKNPMELRELLKKSSREAMEEYDRATSGGGGEAYWEKRCFEGEVEWVCNVVSSVLVQNELPMIVPPTCRGMMMAQKVLGGGSILVFDSGEVG